MIKKYTTGIIYEPIEPLEEEVYAYVHAVRNGEVGFSALPTATRTPDFSNCGIFWVKKNDFTSMFKPYKVPLDGNLS